MVVMVVVECLFDLQVQTQASGQIVVAIMQDYCGNYVSNGPIYACTGKRYLGDTKEQISDIR
jgi:hypothetical protein